MCREARERKKTVDAPRRHKIKFNMHMTVTSRIEFEHRESDPAKVRVLALPCHKARST